VVEYWQKNKPKCRSSGCRLQFGGAEKRPSTSKLQNSSTFFSHARTSNSRCLCFSPKMRCVPFYFERSCPEQRPRAVHCSPKSPTRAGLRPRAPPPRSSRVAGSWSPIKCHWRYLCSREGGPHTAKGRRSSRS
jgi:hypothetical protein